MMRFTASHEWLQLKGNVGTVGITDHAQKELGEIVYIELPKVGQKIQVGQEISVLESTKAAADVYAPVSGTIIAINEALRTTPSIINQAPESNGWLCQIEMSNSKELDPLLTHAQYKAITS